MTCIRTPSINIPSPDKHSTTKTTIIVRDTTFSGQSTWTNGGEDLAFHSGEDESLNIYMTPRNVCMDDMNGRVHIGPEYLFVWCGEGKEDYVVSFNFFGEDGQIQVEMADQTHLVLYICMSPSSESPALIIAHPHKASREHLAVKLKFPCLQTLKAAGDRFYFAPNDTVRTAADEEHEPVSEEE
jgi:hypothetical protein